MPVTLFLCLYQAQKDWENWEKTRKYREKNLPNSILPYKPKYDFNSYEDVILRNQEEAQRKKQEINRSKV